MKKMTAAECEAWMQAHEGRSCSNPDEHAQSSHAAEALGYLVLASPTLSAIATGIITGSIIAGVIAWVLTASIMLAYAMGQASQGGHKP